MDNVVFVAFVQHLDSGVQFSSVQSLRLFAIP